MDEERDIELAEKYVMQHMNSDEAAAFERRMEADPELQNTVAAFQELMSSLKAADKDQLREMLRKQEENINTHKQNKKPFRKYLIRIAALLHRSEHFIADTRNAAWQAGRSTLHTTD